MTRGRGCGKKIRLLEDVYRTDAFRNGFDDSLRVCGEREAGTALTGEMTPKTAG